MGILDLSCISLNSEINETIDKIDVHFIHMRGLYTDQGVNILRLYITSSTLLLFTVNFNPIKWCLEIIK